MPLVQTRGAASAQGFGEFAVTSTPTYIEDVFSCFLYTGNGSTQTITNGIDLSGKGGLVWIKTRTSYGGSHMLMDTVRGQNKYISANLTNAQDTTDPGYGLTTFNTNGFSLGPTWIHYTNSSGSDNVSWTFRKQPKFFDIVTYTGTGSNTTIAHSLGSVPGSIIVKRTDTTAAWAVYHRSLANTQYLVLNTTAAAATGATWWNSTTPTSAVFSVGTDATVNASGGTYVAYIFAHNAGGFGLTGTDNVISCASFTTDSAGEATVSVGYEPQWLLVKSSTSVEDWNVVDNMRGLVANGIATKILKPNLSAAESTGDGLRINATGFGASLTGSKTYIYIAIRRGPMKVPTVGTSVYNADTTITATTPAAVSGFVTDLMISTNRTNKTSYDQMFWSTRLTANGYLSSTNTTQEQAGGAFGAWDTMNGSGTPALQSAGVSDMAWLFRRAPSFFDEVCYTGTGSATTFTHNLGVAPELMIVKNRSSAGYGWLTYSATLGATKYLQLNSTAAEGTVSTYWNNTAPTSSVFSVGTAGATNASGNTFVAYLFATCTGVSKVGSYSGTGSTQTIDCGFTGGARFVLIKRTDSTGDWYVWDSARGIVAGNDPYLLLNSTAAEVTSTDYVDTYSAGFEISSTAPAAINSNGGTFIFLAIA